MGRNRLCAVISGPSLEDALHQIHKVRDTADLVEFRIDLFSFYNLNDIINLRQTVGLPVIFTLRKKSQGGEFSGLESERLLKIQQLMELNPDFFDLEADCPDSFLCEVSRIFPKVKIICSQHIFEDTPANLLDVFEKMLAHPAAIYKLATQANSSLDSMRMLKVVRELSIQGKNIVGICMGELGQSTRILGAVFGSYLTYAVSDNKSIVAPGQIDLKSLNDVYRVKHMNRETMILGLIGDPVKYSISDTTHNAVLKQLGINGVYVKIKVILEECEVFLKYAQELGFYGLSVTMPLKEQVLKFVKTTSNILPINTILFKEHYLQGYNTDGIGFLKAIKSYLNLEAAVQGDKVMQDFKSESFVMVGDHSQKVKAPTITSDCGLKDCVNLPPSTDVSRLNGSVKRVVFLGAGGAAKAAAYMLKDAGLELIILNRNENKAKELAEWVGGKGYSLQQFPKIAKEGYDLLVNSTSVGMLSDECPIDPNMLISHRVVFEMISVPRETALIRAALKKQCKIVYGHEMFMHQAAAQFGIWFGQNHLTYL